MANLNQSGGIFVEGGDITVRNYGGSDIPANTAVLWDTANPGTPQLAPGVTVPTSGQSVAATAGITHTVIPAGSTGLLRRLGMDYAVAGVNVTIGDFLLVSAVASHLGQVTNVDAGALVTLGQAMSTASAGDPVKVLLGVAKNS